MKSESLTEDRNFDDFLKHFEKVFKNEEKLRICLDFMHQTLFGKKEPNFRGFWETRKLCLPLFKEPLEGKERSHLWNTYTGLTQEAIRLKQVFHQETAFVVEQITLAIKALEEEYSQFKEDREKSLAKVTIPFPKKRAFLEKKISFYECQQKEIYLLTLYASRLNDLRKEAIKVPGYFQQKKLFQKSFLSLGDEIFPRRKEAIAKISQHFLEDIEAFLEKRKNPSFFAGGKMLWNIFSMYNEVKYLQSFSKCLSLNAGTFTKIRHDLQGYWNCLKQEEKNFKKELDERKEQLLKNVEQMKEKIAAFQAMCSQEENTEKACSKKYEEILSLMRKLDLRRGDVLSLKEELKAAALPLEEKKKRQEEERKIQEEAFEELRKKKLESFTLKIEGLKEKVATEDVKSLLGEHAECRKQLSSLSLPKQQRQMQERCLQTLRDQILEKEEQILLRLPKEKQQAFENLQEILEKRKVRRREIKNKIEEYRKIIGGSSLDFSKSIFYNEMISKEKELLEKMDTAIQEVEKKISDFEG